MNADEAAFSGIDCPERAATSSFKENVMDEESDKATLRRIYDELDAMCLTDDDPLQAALAAIEEKIESLDDDEDDADVAEVG